MRWLSNEKILVVERDPNRIYECDRSGKIHWEKPLSENPVSCDRLANGNIFVGFGSRIVEMRWDGSIRYEYHFPIKEMIEVRLLQNGHFIGFTRDGQIAELDAKGKLLNKIQFPNGFYGDMAINQRGNYLVTVYPGMQIQEIDRQGKVVAIMKTKIKPWGLDVLPDGSLLVSSDERAIIVGRDSTVRKEFKEEGVMLHRIHMR